MVARYDFERVDVSPLSKPLHFVFSGRTAPNRFMKAAMTERLSSWSPTDLPYRGVPSSNLINVYKRWGEGGFGVILTGNVMIEYDQLEAAGNPIVPPPGAPLDDERFKAFSEMATVSKAHGSLILAQVSHPGRQADDSLVKDPVSASDIQLQGEVNGKRFAKPHAATQAEIDDIVKRWTHAAVYLHKAGFDGIQLHGAHGYLLAQFLSSTTNKRTDKYGGSLENRARLITEIAGSIRKELPGSSGFVLGIKVNSVEFQEGGFTTEEARELCRILEQSEFDFVELSGGTYEKFAFEHKRESSKKRESFFLEFADHIVPGLEHTKAYVTGGFKTASAMVKALDTVHGVGLGRPATQEFHLPKDILEGKVQSAIETKIDPNNFGLMVVAAGMQIKQVGKDQEPTDLSDEKNVEVLQKSLGEWGQKMAEDAVKMNLYGFADLPDGEPYKA